MLPLLLACAFHVPAPSGTPAPLPIYSLKEDPIRVYALWNGALWLVDTGAALTTCDDDFVGAAPVRGRWARQGVGGEIAVGRTVLRDVSLGGATYRRFPCAVRDLPSTSSVPEGVAGVLGANVLERYGVTIDRDRRELRLSAELPEDPSASRLDRKGGRLFGTVTVAGVVTPVLIDTGADTTFLPVMAGEVEAVRPVVIRASGGVSEGSVTIRRAGPVWMGSHFLPLQSFVESDVTPGILGMDALSAAVVTVDFRRRRLSWEGPTGLLLAPAELAVAATDGAPDALAALGLWEIGHGDPERGLHLLEGTRGKVPGTEEAWPELLLQAGHWEEGIRALPPGDGRTRRVVEAIEKGGDPKLFLDHPLVAGRWGEVTGVGPVLLAARRGAPPAQLPGSPAPLGEILRAPTAPEQYAAACARFVPVPDVDHVVMAVACGHLDMAESLLATLPEGRRPTDRAAVLDARALLAMARGDRAGAVANLDGALRLQPFEAYYHLRRGEV